MTSPLDTIAYLARSDHRVDVLEAIRTAPRSREEIRDLTNASRVTTGRIIADLEERGWIVRRGTEYEATTEGRFVAREFTRLMGNLETYDQLPPVVEWFPDGQPTFDLRLLADATVTTADEGDLIAPIRRALELIDRSDRLVAVANGAAREFVEATREAVESGQTTTLLGPPAMVEELRSDPAQRSDTRAILDSGRATLLRYEGEAELPVFQIGDGSVALCSGDHRAMVETDHDAVHDWATSYVESLRSRATEVSPEAFVEDSTRQDDEVLVE